MTKALYVEVTITQEDSDKIRQSGCNLLTTISDVVQSKGPLLPIVRRTLFYELVLQAISDLAQVAVKVSQETDKELIEESKQ